MLMQILSHTPVYVWVALALLVLRGVSAASDREMAFGRLLIIPLVMPLLSLQDISGRFGAGAAGVALWAAAAIVTAAVTWKVSAARVSPGRQDGKVLVRGSWVPLAVMMAVFFTKYAAIVTLAVHPQARQDMLFVGLACSLFGVFNGIFFGRLVRDAGAWMQMRAQALGLQG
jgi:hypothetical protein